MKNTGRGAKPICFNYMVPLIILFFSNFPALILSEPLVPCYFVFGDSLVDNGNNNELQTAAKVNYPPYGIDFPAGPTGRFSNGRNMADFIAMDLGFEDYIPPFATVKDDDIIRGVNYASGGAGILPETGNQLGEVICLDRQLANHEIAISRIVALHENESFSHDYLTKCIYTVGMGNNDYIQNYFAPQFHNSSRVLTPDEFATSLIDRYSKQLHTLYELGARKIAIFGLGSIGCTPAEISMFRTDENQCVTKMNDAVSRFNNKLQPLADDLNEKTRDAKFVVIPSVPSNPGIVISNSPCCEVFMEGGTRGQCIPNEAPCHNRLQHIFFDGFHPTESSSFVVAQAAFLSFAKFLI